MLPATPPRILGFLAVPVLCAVVSGCAAPEEDEASSHTDSAISLGTFMGTVSGDGALREDLAPQLGKDRGRFSFVVRETANGHNALTAVIELRNCLDCTSPDWRSDDGMLSFDFRITTSPPRPDMQMTCDKFFGRSAISCRIELPDRFGRNDETTIVIDVASSVPQKSGRGFFFSAAHPGD